MPFRLVFAIFLALAAHASQLQIVNVAGAGKAGFSGDGGPAAESHTIRYLDPKTGQVHLLAGTGLRGDGATGEATKCALSRPHGVYADKNGFVWIGDSENHRVRCVRSRAE